MKPYLPTYARTFSRPAMTLSPRFLLKAACIAVAVAGLALVSASGHVYSTPDSLGVAYNDLGGIDIIGPGYQPALFVCANGPLAQALWFWRVDC